MTVANHTFDITWIEGRGRDSRLPTGLPSLEGTALALAMAAATPGRLVQFTSSSLGGFDTWTNFRRWRSDGNNLPSDDQTWGGKGCWDRKRKLALYIGDRTSNTQPERWNLKIYRASSDEWYHGSHVTPEGARIGRPHTYGHQCIDDERGWLFYGASDAFLYRYLIDEDRWEAPAVTPISGQDASGTCGRDYHEGIGLILTSESRGSNSRILGLDPATLAWSSLGAAGHDAHHTHCKYNRVRGDMLFLHGTNSQRRVTLVHSDGTYDRMADIPASVDDVAIPVGMGEFHLTYDPVSGNYLWVCVGSSARKIFEYNPDEDEWRLAANFATGQPHASDWPGPYYGHLGIPIEELGGCLWVTSYPPRIYKHVSAFEE